MDIGKRALRPAMALVVVSVLSGCGPASTPTNTNAATTTPPSNQPTVSIAGFAFSPSRLEISPGTTVTWTNQDSVIHTVTSDAGLFRSANLSRGSTFSRTFDETGEFAYHCTPHPYMKAVVIVR